MSQSDQDAVIGRAVRELRDAQKDLETLRAKARQLGEQFIRIGTSLKNPDRAIFGPGRRILQNQPDWDVHEDDALPTIEELTGLTDAIRAAAQKVDQAQRQAKSLGIT